MAKKSMIEREKKRIKLYHKYALNVQEDGTYQKEEKKKNFMANTDILTISMPGIMLLGVGMIIYNIGLYAFYICITLGSFLMILGVMMSILSRIRFDVRSILQLTQLSSRQIPSEENQEINRDSEAVDE